MRLSSSYGIELATFLVVIKLVFPMRKIFNHVKSENFSLVGASDVPFGYDLVNGNFVHQTAQINWDRVDIGVGNRIGPFCIIGGEAQHRYYSSCGEISIGDHNIFQEHVSVNLPTSISKNTKVGSGCFFMTSAVVHHDCLIEDDVTMCSNASIGGSVIVMRGANIGMNASVHQFKTIGSYTMLGMNGCVIKGSNIRPGRKFVGVPVRDIGSNSIGLSRAKITENLLQIENQRFAAFNDYLKFGLGA